MESFFACWHYSRGPPQQSAGTRGTQTTLSIHIYTDSESVYPPNQDELLKNEIARLKNRLSQQERMLSGAVKRLRTTNQLKEGMERVIIDQCKMLAFNQKAQLTEEN